MLNETNADLAMFLRSVYAHIETIKRMRGESLYWRYTLSMQLIHKIYWPLRDAMIPTPANHNSEFDRDGIFDLQVAHVCRALDKQFKSILQEGKTRHQRLPHKQTKILLETYHMGEFYLDSYKCLGL